MDRLFRLSWSAFMLACIVALLAPRLASAAGGGYSYSPKEPDMSTSVAKVPTNRYATTKIPGITYATPDEWKPPLCGHNTAAMAPFPVTCGDVTGPDGSGNYAFAWAFIYQGTNNRTDTIYLQVHNLCPEGSEEVSGICRPLICVAPAEEDPANPDQCRQEHQCSGWASFWNDGCACPSNAAERHTKFGAQSYIVSGNLAPGATTCIGGCEVTVGGDVTNVKDGSGWVSVFQITGSSGNECAPAEEEKTEDQPPNEWQTCLAAGGYPGTVNGNFACLQSGEVDSKTYGKPTTTTKTETHADGSQTITETTQTPVTECVNGVCTTTITTTTRVIQKDSQGNVTSDDESGDDTVTSGGGGGDNVLEGFCKENPNSIICKQSTWGGSCGGGFTCDGDAVQCAIAQEQHARNCEFWEEKGGFGRDAAVTEFDETREFDRSQLNAEPQAFGEGIGSSTFLGGGCVQDAQFNLWGGETLTIPFSALCPYLSAAGNAFMVVCGLIAFAVVRRGVEV